MTEHPSPRQSEILVRLADGATDKEIAKAMGVSPETVYQQMKRLLIKLGAANRTHAVSLAYRRGYLSLREDA